CSQREHRPREPYPQAGACHLDCRWCVACRWWCPRVCSFFCDWELTMSSLTDGLPRADEIVELAAQEGLDLACAVVLLQKESGGRNVWGHDPVDTGGVYVKGSEVTREAYLEYKRRNLPAQGVGPCQLTYKPFQQQADDIGGCWDWRRNVTIGFRILAGYIK